MINYVSIIIAGPFEDDLSAITACDVLAGTARARGWPVVDEQYCRIDDTDDTTTEDTASE